MTRPHGDIRQALLGAAGQQPGSVRQLADRAQVGYATARYTASRMVASGDLVVIDPGERPVQLASAALVVPAGDALASALDELHRSFWDDF